MSTAPPPQNGSTLSKGDPPRAGLSIPVPVHPTETHLPRSDVRLLLCHGGIIEVLGVPLQGPRTLEAMLKTLEIWKPTIVKGKPEYQFNPRP